MSEIHQPVARPQMRPARKMVRSESRKEDINVQVQEKGLEFLIEDFKDTSEHLRTTQRKMELPFQIYAAGLAVVISALPSLVSFFDEHFADYSNYTLVVLLPIIFVANIIFLEWCLRAIETKDLYINRLNFLRKQIYLRTQVIVPDQNCEGFYWISKNVRYGRKKIKVGMNDLIPLSLMGITLALWLVFWFWPLKNHLMQAGLAPAFTHSFFYPVVGIVVFILIIVNFLFRWQSLNKDVANTVTGQWLLRKSGKGA